ncbi:MAG TPA: hypothetical protein VJ715_12190 [Pyrinomonadaceae bacterium]|nr:hypothetical protein [Pyrinomonadaceae bacterium]
MKFDEDYSNTLDKLLDNVSDAHSFLQFVKALIADRKDELAKEKENPSSPFGPGANGWENGSIESYLDAAVAWAEDSRALPQEPSWKAFAQFLYSGKYYE